MAADTYLQPQLQCYCWAAGDFQWPSLCKHECFSPKPHQQDLLANLDIWQSHGWKKWHLQIVAPLHVSCRLAHRLPVQQPPQGPGSCKSAPLPCIINISRCAKSFLAAHRHVVMFPLNVVTGLGLTLDVPTHIQPHGVKCHLSDNSPVYIYGAPLFHKPNVWLLSQHVLLKI